MFDRLKSLPLVVILTVLIWLYAEAQFTARQDNVRLAVKIASPPGDYTVRVVDGADDRMPNVVTFTVTLQGAKGQVEKLYQRSLGVSATDEQFGPLPFTPKGSELRPGETDIDAVGMFNSMRYFRDAGVIVTSANPPRVRLAVQTRQADQLLKLDEVPVTISALPGTLDRFNVELQPKAVTLTLVGPETAIAALRQRNTVKATLDIAPEDQPTQEFVRRKLNFVLPPGVRVRDGQMDAEFRLIRRPTS